MSKVIEMFGVNGHDISQREIAKIIEKQECPFLGRKCIKVRKSQPEISIGTCSVNYSKAETSIIICPFRLLERRQIFIDCIHLLNTHEPGNELHIIPEVSIPGGSVDYFLVSAKDSKVKDFVGIELQTLDTTGTVWPERQKWLAEHGVEAKRDSSSKTFGMNWKMTAKTILIQMHHKIHTFENVNKHLALVVQDCLLNYLRKEFQFSHFKIARTGDSMHLHSYKMTSTDGVNKIDLDERISTDAEGISICLGLQAESKVELKHIIQQLESKISKYTLFTSI